MCLVKRYQVDWMACSVFLEINGVRASTATNDDVYDFVMEVASGHSEISQIADGLRRIVRG